MDMQEGDNTEEWKSAYVYQTADATTFIDRCNFESK